MSSTIDEAMETETHTNGSITNKDEAWARSLGRTLGLQVAFWFVALGILGTLWSAMVHPEGLGSQLALLAVWGIPTLAAGSLGGRLLGPRAMRARHRSDWAVCIAMLSIVAVLIGDFGVSLALSIGWGFTSEPTSILVVLQALSFVVMFAGYGLLVSPFVLPITLVAASIWTFRMRRAINAAAMRAPASGAVARA